VLRGTGGIVRVRVIPVAEVRDMVRPWLGETADQEDLPLPHLIDVGLAENADVDLDDLRTRVAEAVPGATIEDHHEWLRQLADIAQASLFLSLAVVGLIVFATVITIVFAARTGLRVHARVTDVLHLIGAPDRYIARQFERQAFWLGFRGALIGSGLAAATVYGLGQLVGRVEAFDISAVALSPWQWAVFGIFPLAAAIIARITARITVLRTLARKP
jgi:cell division transport system permease protein